MVDALSVPWLCDTRSQSSRDATPTIDGRRTLSPLLFTYLSTFHGPYIVCETLTIDDHENNEEERTIKTNRKRPVTELEGIYVTGFDVDQEVHPRVVPKMFQRCSLRCLVGNKLMVMGRTTVVGVTGKVWIEPLLNSTSSCRRIYRDPLGRWTSSRVVGKNPTLKLEVRTLPCHTQNVNTCIWEDSKTYGRGPPDYGIRSDIKPSIPQQ